MEEKRLSVRDVLTGSTRPPEMERLSVLRGARKYAHPLFLTTLALWLVVTSCDRDGTSAAPSPVPFETPVVAVSSLKIAEVEAQPLDQVLPQFDEETRQFIKDFEVTIPDPLPPLALATFTAINPDQPILPLPDDKQALVGRTLSGQAEALVVRANLGSNSFQENVLCLRNGRQVSCSPEADLWQFTLAPETAALMTARMLAERGDHLVFLFLPDRDTERVQRGATIKWVYVEERIKPPRTWVEAPTHRRLYGGCDFVTLIKDPDSTDPLNFNLYAGVRRGTTLYLLIQLCDPSGNEYIQLAAVADRTIVIDLPGNEWRSPLRLHSAAHLLPVDTAHFGQAKEFQIALIPISDEAKLAFRNKSFTQAVLLRDP